MSTEDIIREKHRVASEVTALQKSLQEWHRSFSLLSSQELELAAATAMDKVIASPGDRDLKFRLLVLGAAIKRRDANYRVSSFKRFWLLADPQLLIDKFMSQSLHVPIEVDDTSLKLLAEST